MISLEAGKTLTIASDPAIFSVMSGFYIFPDTPLPPNLRAGFYYVTEYLTKQ